MSHWARDDCVWNKCECLNKPPTQALAASEEKTPLALQASVFYTPYHYSFLKESKATRNQQTISQKIQFKTFMHDLSDHFISVLNI